MGRQWFYTEALMILTLVAAVVAIVIATGVIIFWRRGLDGFRPSKREVRPEGPQRGDGRGGTVNLDALPETARIMTKTTPPVQSGLGKLPTIKAPAAQGHSERAERRAQRRRGLLPADAVITFADERKAAAIDDVFAALDRELVGLVPIKKQVEEIGSLLLVDRVRQRFGLLAPRPNLHMCFTGAPGTGKTTVGLLMADLLHQLGYLERGQLVHAMRDDMVGEFVGQTAPKTRRVLERAMGGVLFIDEASALYQPDNSKDFGLEAIETLLQVMENERDRLIVILAGYKDRMDTFFESNPGLRSRIAHHMDFANYDVDELVAIGKVMLERASYYLSESAEMAFREYLTIRMQQPLFANARSVRNELERARLRHAHRLAADWQRHWKKDDLMRIEADDIFGGRVLSAPGVIGPGIS
jgi:probable Rubsico expression protein CbbX